MTLRGTGRGGVEPHSPGGAGKAGLGMPPAPEALSERTFHLHTLHVYPRASPTPNPETGLPGQKQEPQRTTTRRDLNSQGGLPGPGGGCPSSPWLVWRSKRDREQALCQGLDLGPASPILCILWDLGTPALKLASPLLPDEPESREQRSQSCSGPLLPSPFTSCTSGPLPLLINEVVSPRQTPPRPFMWLPLIWVA